MRARRLVVLVVLTWAGCIDDPVSPDPSAAGLGSGPQLALLHLRNGGTAELPPIVGTSEVFPRDVNRWGDVVGTSVGAGGPRSVLWRPAGHFATGRDAPVLRDLAPLEHPVAIDDDHRVAGSLGGVAAIWTNGTVTPLGALPGDDRSFPTTGSSLGGYVVGNSWSSSLDFDVDARGFRWSGGSMVELPPLPGDESSRAMWVNGSGTVAGVSIAPDVGRGLVVVWRNGIPTSTGYDFTTHPPLGISENDEVLLSAVSGDDLFTWRNGVVTRYPHPTPENPSALYWGVSISAPGEVLAKVEVDEPFVDVRFGRFSARDFVFLSPSPIAECPFFDWSFAICTSPMRDHPFTVLTEGRSLSPGAVRDLTVTGQTATSVTLRWTQVDDGRGRPARYRVRYSEAPIHVEDWSAETKGCDVPGTAIGAEGSCTIHGLRTGVPYDFQAMSYRSEDGAWNDARYSNVGIGEPGAGGGEAPPEPESPAEAVLDLRVTNVTASSATLTWTQVDDGTGMPAHYRLRYSEAPMGDWKSSSLGCDRKGDQIGATVSCTVQSLANGTAYEFLLMSYRTVDGAWVGARYSNVAAGSTN